MREAAVSWMNIGTAACTVLHNIWSTRGSFYPDNNLGQLKREMCTLWSLQHMRMSADDESTHADCLCLQVCFTRSKSAPYHLIQCVASIQNSFRAQWLLIANKLKRQTKYTVYIVFCNICNAIHCIIGEFRKNVSGEIVFWVFGPNHWGLVNLLQKYQN